MGEAAFMILAARGVPVSDDAFMGALMEADYQAHMILLTRAFIRAHTPKK